MALITRFQLGLSDPNAAIIPIFITQSGQSFIYLTVFHSDGESTEVPDSIQDFLDVPHVVSTLRRTTMSGLGKETNGGPIGLR